MSTTKDKDTIDLFELWISTTLVANNLLQHENQSIIVKKLMNIFGEDNIVGINFGYMNNRMEREASWVVPHPMSQSSHIHRMITQVYIHGKEMS